ncbi:MAG: CapA family protein [Alphaproteobacteria bacterium]|nr:CapA family protein [Alphaproteobacteria bacterium]
MLWMLSLAHAGAFEDGLAALQSGKPDVAKEHLSAATAADPANSEAWWELGWACWTLKDWAAAETAWKRVEALDPKKDELQHWLGAARTRKELATVKGPLDPVSTEPSEGRVRIAAAGDTMMGSDLKKGPEGLAPGDGESIFADSKAILSAADIAFLNLEGPLADGLPSTKCGPKSTSCYAFRTPTRYTKALVSAGIDVASLANNHASDLGAAGQQASMDALDAAGIAHAGRYGDVAMLERGGTKIAFLAAHSGSCCLNVNEIEEIQAAVRLADREADIVVLSFHGGAEGYSARNVPGRTEVAWGEKRGDVKALAHAAIDAGADLVIGHGPHVLRGMEVYRGRLVAYSMGNFVGFRQFGTQGGFGGTSAILDAELAGNGVLVSARIHPMALDDEGVPHPDPSGAAWEQIRELTAADFPQTGVKIGPDGTLSW